MKPLFVRRGFRAADWDEVYRESTPSWETGRPARELISILDEGLVQPCVAIELGCGTGANAVLLARRGFELTAIDCSPTAVERARTRAQQCRALLHFVLDDLYQFAQSSGSFDFVFDAGFYHYARLDDLPRYLDVLWRITRPGSIYLTLAGRAGEEDGAAEPQVTDEEIRFELGRLFEFVRLRPVRFDSPCRADGFPGWSCLMRRPIHKFDSVLHREGNS